MEGIRPRNDLQGTRVRLSGRLDSLTTCKSSVGYTLIGSFRLDAPYRGLSLITLQLPIGSSLLPGDSAELEGTLRPAELESWLLDCCS